MRNMNAVEMQREIERLEESQVSQWLTLKEEWVEIKSSTSIEGLDQRVIDQLLVTKPFYDNFLANFLALTTGYIINKIYPTKPSGLLAKVSKLTLEYLVSKFIAKKIYQLLTLGSSLVKSFFKNKISLYEKNRM